MTRKAEMVRCPRCGGSFVVDTVPEFSGCINCGHDIPPGHDGKLIRTKWSDVLRDGRKLGWEAACKKWRLGKTAKKRLKRELQKEESCTSKRQ